MKIPALPLTKFYDTAQPLPPGKPGEVIRSAEFGGYDLPIEVSAVRFLYHSRTATGQDVASSGVILFPYKTAPAGGWPVIAWAHDVSGVGRHCAPSLSRTLERGPLLSMYVKLGYAVVATDYTGLGTDFRHAYGDAWSNAWDVMYSVEAARRAVPQLGSKWVAMGTGHGAMAAIAVNELEHDIHDSNYLGSIEIAPLVELGEQSEVAGPLLAYGIKTVYPQFDAKEILTPSAMALSQQLEKACTGDQSGIQPKLPERETLQPGWQNNPTVQKYFERNRIGANTASAPFLVVSGEDDPLKARTAKVVERLCQRGDRVEFEKYPDDPGSVVGDSARDQMAWMQARFANRATPNECPMK